MRVISRAALIGFSCVMAACSDMGETTTMGAATGGVLGAGLGAIVGSQTGSPGGGLVIGAVAGSAAGAAVGSAIEGQERTIRTQDEAIERHERTIVAQRAEIDELRRLNGEPGSIAALTRDQNYGQQYGQAYGRQENPSLRDQPTGFVPHIPEQNAAATTQNQMAASNSLPSQEHLREATIVDQSAAYKQRDAQPNLAVPLTAVNPRTGNNAQTEVAASPLDKGAYNWGSGGTANATGGALGAVTQPQVRALNLNTPECVQAEGEVQKAGGSSELADKLFHFRRALRLCPDNPAYHNGLGEVYMSLNRRTDAEFEFREALNLNPTFQPALNNINSIK